MMFKALPLSLLLSGLRFGFGFVGTIDYSEGGSCIVKERRVSVRLILEEEACDSRVFDIRGARFAVR